MAGIWFSYMAAIWMLLGRYMALPYGCCMNTMQEAYGTAICLLYGTNMAAIWLNHMDAILILCSRHMAV